MSLSTDFIQSFRSFVAGGEPAILMEKIAPLWSDPNSSCGRISQEVWFLKRDSESSAASINEDPVELEKVGIVDASFATIRLLVSANSSIHSPRGQVLGEFQRVLFEFKSPAIMAEERCAPTRGSRIWVGGN